jgi:replicative DNA helicase
VPPEAERRPRQEGGAQDGHGGGNVTLTVPDVTGLDTLTAALAYAKGGWYVGWHRRGTKNPGSLMGSDWQQKTTRDPQVLTAMLAGTDHGIFLHAGRSGAVIIDVDTVAELAACPPLVDAIAAHIKAGHPVQSTGPGRGHYVFLQPPGRILGNSKGKLAGAWGEIRGRNGVIVVEPTPHPDGREYRWLTTGPVPELPAALAALLPDTTDAEDAATDAEVAAFLAAHTARWQPHRLELTVADLEKKLRAGEARHDTALVKTTLALREAAAGYFSAADAVRRIGEVFTASAQRDRGTGTRTRTRAEAGSEYAGIVAWAVAQVTAGNESDTGAGGSGSSPGSSWEPPVPLGAVPQLPAFPVDIYPDWLRQEITCLTEFAQVPADLPAVITLPVLGAAAGGRVIVEIRGSWREPVNLYAVTALPPGSRKSAVFAELTQPLLDAEHHMLENAGPRITEAATERKIAQRDADKLAAQAAGLKGDARNQAQAEAIAAAQMAEAITVPVMPKLVADDITPEAAASLLAEQGGRLAVLSAEGGCFSTLSGRYAAAPNLEVFLKGHSGDMLRVDRKGRPPEHIPHPALTLGLAVQPQVLRDIATMPGFRGRGLLARILYSIPPNTVGIRKIRTDPIPEDIRDTYTAGIRALVLTLAEWTDPAVLVLTPDAAELLLTAAEELEPRLAPDGDLGHIADWASKLIGATGRIAGLLHLATNLRDGWGKPITEDTMAAAIRAAGYFTAHALAAFGGMGADPLLEDARHVLAWLTRTQAEKFTKRDLFRATQSRFRKIADLDPVLAILDQHGYIRQDEPADRAGPGRRPSPEYAVHPSMRG